MATLTDVPEAAREHYEEVLALESEAVLAAAEAWRGVSPSRVEATWEPRAASLTVRLSRLQEKAAFLGATYGAMTLAQQGEYVAPDWLVDVAAFAGWVAGADDTTTGTDLSEALAGPSWTAIRSLSAGESEAVALRRGRLALERIAQTAVADAARMAAGVDVAARRQVGYVRMLNPPSCARCVILAGRFYRWNSGFQRHPRCDCIHVPATESRLRSAKAEGLLTDPYDYFSSLSEREQDAIFTKYGAQAIRDGADIYQVVNARRGMDSRGKKPFTPAWSTWRARTSEGTTKYGAWRKRGGQGSFRLTPEAIYHLSYGDREVARQLLRSHGYILDEGQVPGGAIRGNRTGYGQMGKGGKGAGARDAINFWDATGYRDPNSRYTMTAAEKRVADARWRWEVAKAGFDPYSPGAFELFRGMSGRGGDLRASTPEMIARLEYEYRYWLARSGNVYID